MDAMAKGHEADIADFHREANNENDADFKAFASKTPPAPQEHLHMATDGAGAFGAM
jgi:hypothetical protein